jgi:small-conductance mechanosensitive channel
VANKHAEIDSEASPQMLDRLRQLSDQRKMLAELNKRIQGARDLTVVYSRWITLVQARRAQAVHLLLRSLALVLAIVLVALLIDRGIRRAFGRVSDPRRLYQVRTMATIAVQLVAAGLIVLVVVGPPNQVSTILGLATAGLTIVLKDFIVAFFGWFALMGKNGVRIGNWVEIGGVSGEVIEIGVFKTVLLEMGNWTSAGHPTGRRVGIMNNFAIEGHYFNFSTTGQWLWDELQITLPAGVDPYRAAQQIRELVERETDADSSAAQKEWERVTQQYKTRTFSAKPAVEFRTSSKGLDLAVRYITRAPQLFETRARLQQLIVEVLQAKQTTG